MNALCKISIFTGLVLSGASAGAVDIADWEDDLAAIAENMDEAAGNDLDRGEFPRWTVARHDASGVCDVTGECIRAYVSWFKRRYGMFAPLHVAPWWAEHDDRLRAVDLHDDPQAEVDDTFTLNANRTPCWGRPTGAV